MEGGQITIAQKVLQCKGPFAAVILVQKAQFNGKDWLMASVVAEVMANLQTDGLGMVKKRQDSPPSGYKGKTFKRMECNESHKWFSL